MKDNKQQLGPLDGKFEYKKNDDGTVDRQRVLCTFCWKEFSFHRSTSSLKYHINAKHTTVGDSGKPLANASPGMQQSILTERPDANVTLLELNGIENDPVLRTYFKEEEESPPEAEPEPSTSRESTEEVIADSVRQLYKRKLELDIEHRTLQIKIARLELEKLQQEKKEREKRNKWLLK